MRNNKNLDLIIIVTLSLAGIYFIFSVLNSTLFLRQTLKLIVFVIILLFFFYEKTKKIKHQLYAPILRYYSKGEFFFESIFRLITRITKPVNIGPNVLLDTSQFIFLFIMLILLLTL